mmetsp:Transcript_99274/g.269798  ORF Transcript_99274/g.269798 Transcript_99274/m.269798 type:complete len:511 (+) Transcript_99274:51-1583(+)
MSASTSPEGGFVKSPATKHRRTSDLQRRGAVPHSRVYALHHGLDLFLRAHLVKLRDAGLDHVAHRRLPEHGGRQLPLQQLHDLLRVRARLEWLRRGVHPHAVGRRLHAREQLVQGLPELLLRRLHQRRVEAARGLENFCLQYASRHGLLLQHLYGLPRAGAREALREELVGDHAHAAWPLRCRRLLAQLRDDVLVEASHRDHALRAERRSLLHRLAAQLHQPQAVLEAEDAGRAQRGVLAQRQAGRHAEGPGHLWPVQLQLLEPSHAGDEHCRLAVAGLLELRVGPVEAQVEDVEPENGLGLLQHLAHGGDVLHRPHHVHVLRALPREEQSYGQRPLRRRGGRRHGRRGHGRGRGRGCGRGRGRGCGRGPRELRVRLREHGLWHLDVRRARLGSLDDVASERLQAVLGGVQPPQLGHPAAAHEPALGGLLAELPAPVDLGVVALASRHVPPVRGRVLRLLQDWNHVIPPPLLRQLQRRAALLRVLAVRHGLLDVGVCPCPQQQLDALCVP